MAEPMNTEEALEAVMLSLPIPCGLDEARVFCELLRKQGYAVTLAPQKMVAVMRTWLPIRTVSEANGSHGSWPAKNARTEEQRGTAKIVMSSAMRVSQDFRKGDWPVQVVLTRHSAGELDSHDNLRGSLKHVVDGIADAFGVKDNHPGLSWEYAPQFRIRKAKGAVPGVMVQVYQRERP